MPTLADIVLGASAEQTARIPLERPIITRHGKLVLRDKAWTTSVDADTYPILQPHHPRQSMSRRPPPWEHPPKKNFRDEQHIQPDPS